MKIKKLLFLTAPACLLALSLVFAACEHNARGISTEIPTELVGSWVSPDNPAVLVINADGTGEIISGTSRTSCSWSVYGYILNLANASGEGSIKYSVSGNKLTFSKPATGILEYIDDNTTFTRLLK
ncbi:MAG: hypothetical protein LBC27_07665 [Spirochaetaceae bacterium]|jgi:hypothetical protein|nr:hypothetical protein [Spirochaetaceae bacterium]